MIITRAENAHSEVSELYASFVSVVKQECIMNVHFFSFTSLPELIVRKNYNRKHYELLRKLLVTVKDQYLVQRAKQGESVDDPKSGKEKDPHAPK